MTERGENAKKCPQCGGDLEGLNCPYCGSTYDSAAKAPTSTSPEVTAQPDAALSLEALYKQSRTAELKAVMLAALTGGAGVITTVVFPVVGHATVQGMLEGWVPPDVAYAALCLNCAPAAFTVFLATLTTLSFAEARGFHRKIKQLKNSHQQTEEQN